MIGADARGRMAGHEASKHYSPGLPVEEIERIARQIRESLLQDGYAHLEPEILFIRGFVEEFRVAPVLRTSST